MTRDEAIAKIKKCLALGRSAQPHEAGAAMRQAQKLMQAHSITDLDIEHSDIKEEGNRAARRVVMAFHEWDKQGDAFRYAVRRDGGPIVLREQQIDLVRLRDVMEGFANFLGGVDGALDAAGSEGPW